MVIFACVITCFVCDDVRPELSHVLVCLVYVQLAKAGTFILSRVETRFKPRGELHLLAWFAYNAAELELSSILKWRRDLSPEVNFTRLLACLLAGFLLGLRMKKKLKLGGERCLLVCFVMRLGWKPHLLSRGEET